MRIKDTSTVYAYSISVCMGSFVFGYQLSSYGNVLPFVNQYNFSGEYQYQNKDMLLTSILALAAIFGVLIYRWMLKSFGWIQTFKLTDMLTIFAAFVGILSLSTGCQLFSRILYGIVAGINTIIIPTYLTSVLPGSMGGPAGTLNQLFITIGIFTGYWVGFIVLGQQVSDFGWRFIVALPVIPALIRLHTAQNVYRYESVEYMVQNNVDDALQSYLDLIYQDVTLEEFKEMKTLPREDYQSEEATFYDPAGLPYRKRLLMATAIVFFNQLSGGAALGYFANISFRSLFGFGDDTYLSCFVYLNLLQVVVTLIAGQLLEKYGRRAFMQEGIKVILVSLLLVGCIQTFAPELSFFTGILTFIQMIGFSLSYGPCSFLIGTQILYDIFYPSVLLWIFIFLNGIVIAPIVAAIGMGPLCLIYFVIEAIGYLYFAGYQVQTQGRSRKDVYADYRYRPYADPVDWFQKKLIDAKKAHQNEQKETQMKLIQPHDHQ